MPYARQRTWGSDRAVTAPPLSARLGRESINFQLRKITKARGHFPSDEAAMKLLYLGLRNMTSNRGGNQEPEYTAGGQRFTLVIYFPGRLKL